MKMKYAAVTFLLLFLSGLLCLSSLAESESGFNPGLSVDRTNEAEGTFTVEVQHNEVLAARQPSLSLPCSYAAAEITNPDGKVQPGEVADGAVQFKVAMGGIYTITKKAPSSATVYTISGRITTADAGKADIVLLDKNGANVPGITITVDVDSYTITNVPAGEYILRVSREKHVTRDYPVSVGLQNGQQ